MLLCIFLVIFKTFFVIPVVKENTRVTLALAIPAGTLITLEKKIIDSPLLFADKTIKALSI